jgi:hypothetical protein
LRLSETPGVLLLLRMFCSEYNRVDTLAQKYVQRKRHQHSQPRRTETEAQKEIPVGIEQSAGMEETVWARAVAAQQQFVCSVRFKDAKEIQNRYTHTYT